MAEIRFALSVGVPERKWNIELKACRVPTLIVFNTCISVSEIFACLLVSTKQRWWICRFPESAVYCEKCHNLVCQFQWEWVNFFVAMYPFKSHWRFSVEISTTRSSFGGSNPNVFRCITVGDVQFDQCMNQGKIRKYELMKSGCFTCVFQLSSTHLLSVFNVIKYVSWSSQLQNFFSYFDWGFDWTMVIERQGQSQNILSIIYAE